MELKYTFGMSFYFILSTVAALDAPNKDKRYSMAVLSASCLFLVSPFRGFDPWHNWGIMAVFAGLTLAWIIAGRAVKSSEPSIVVSLLIVAGSGTLVIGFAATLIALMIFQPIWAPIIAGEIVLLIAYNRWRDKQEERQRQW